MWRPGLQTRAKRRPLRPGSKDLGPTSPLSAGGFTARRPESCARSVSRRSCRPARGTPRRARRRCRAASCSAAPSTYTGQLGASPVPGRLMPILAAFDSPGPFTTQPITASVMVSTPVVLHLPLGHPFADVLLDAFGQLLERAAGGAPAAGARGDARRERAQPERLEQLARGVHLLAPIAAGASASATRGWCRRCLRSAATPIAAADQTRPFVPMPASVRPRCSG